MATPIQVGGVRPSAPLLLASALLAALLVTLGSTPAAASPPGACRIRNNTSGDVYTRLRQAVRRARPGDRLVVSGTCRGGTFINKDLTIKGRASLRSGRSTLDGGGRARVVTIKPGVRVRMMRLTIQNGRTRRVARGGAISNRGTLKLRDVVVRRSTATDRGGGVFNQGVLDLSGASRITGNAAGTSGGGIYNEGILRVKGTSRISRNRAADGGGIHNVGAARLLGLSRVSRNRSGPIGTGGGVLDRGELTMSGRSSIRRNRAAFGGGVASLGGSMTMNNSSSVSGNRAVQTAGGVIVDSTSTLTMTGSSAIRRNRAARVGGLQGLGTLIGVVCAPHTYANVYWNRPDECALG